MATTTITDGNIYVFIGTVSTNIITHNANELVKIHSTKIDYSYDNPIVFLPIPVSKGGRGVNTLLTRAIDLKRVKEVISVQGFLDDESGESATTKRDNLLTLGKSADWGSTKPDNTTGGSTDGSFARNTSLAVLWGTSGNYRTYWRPNDNAKINSGAFILKMMFTETSGIVGENVSGDSQPERNIAIQIQLVRGKDM